MDSASRITAIAVICFVVVLAWAGWGEGLAAPEPGETSTADTGFAVTLHPYLVEGVLEVDIAGFPEGQLPKRLVASLWQEGRGAFRSARLHETCSRANCSHGMGRHCGARCHPLVSEWCGWLPRRNRPICISIGQGQPRGL